MQQAIYKQINSFNQATYEATRKLIDINVKTYEKLLQQQFALAGLCIENSTNQLELTRGVKDFNSLAENQLEMTRQCAVKAQSVAKATIDILVETRGELDAWQKESISKIVPSTS